MSGRIDGCLKFHQWWPIVRELFDEAIAFTWEQLADGGVSWQRMYLSHKKALHLLADPDAWMRIHQAKGDVDKCGTDIIGVSKSCLVGKSMFEMQLKKCARLEYKMAIEKELKDLEHIDFDFVGVMGFQEVMKGMARNLVESGHKGVSKALMKVKFFGTDMAVTNECIMDEWEWRLAALMKTNAVNTHQLTPLPWELLCFPRGEVPGARETGTIPDELLEGYQAAREASRDYINDISSVTQPTLDEMTKVISGRFKQLHALDRSFTMDFEFLEQHAPRIIQARCRKEILAEMPDAQHARTYKEVLAG